MEFKVGDKVRVIVDDHLFFNKGHEFVVDRVDVDGDVYDENNICILKQRVELVTPKQSKKQRIEAVEKEVAELKERVEALEQAEKQRYVMGVDVAKEVHKTSNQQRKEIIEKAKKFVEENSVGCHFDAPNINKRLGILSTLNVNFGISDELQFIEVKEKRKVVALIRDMNDRKVYHKGIAKCSPDDVFNVHIGKAIALGRALGKDVSEFENAVKPTKVVVGMNVKSKNGKTFYVHGFHKDEKYGRTIATRGINDPHWIAIEQVTILDDTNAEYGVEK